MWPDRVSNPGPLILESDALPTALCDPRTACVNFVKGSVQRSSTGPLLSVARDLVPEV